MLHMHKFEKIWMIVGVITLISFLTIVGVQAFSKAEGEGHHGAPSDMTLVDPETVTETAPFNEPGLKQIGENEYELVMVLQSYGFTPGDIEIPQGATVHIKATSIDVVHGFEIAGTSANMMVTPGHVNSMTYTFDKKGSFLILCNEYCGTGHHFMSTNLEVI
ncbi:cytochrome c oxidase subunit II [Allobacillus sp. GCM10007491]|uniref:Cytochrome aa3 subunit 2 n=1 Tax=Allobacillus saliphilus TaxID=2912308 RepID=A0A941CZ80_9BACI|nr:MULTISPECIES: cytochrome c oxidase subunit II [Allobacillus]MBR7554790.1 cytochrome c oxidase subunit II [Allobacillus saliphilus]